MLKYNRKLEKLQSAGKCAIREPVTADETKVLLQGVLFCNFEVVFYKMNSFQLIDTNCWITISISIL